MTHCLNSVAQLPVNYAYPTPYNSSRSPPAPNKSKQQAASLMKSENLQLRRERKNETSCTLALYKVVRDCACAADTAYRVPHQPITPDTNQQFTHVAFRQETSRKLQFLSKNRFDPELLPRSDWGVAPLDIDFVFGLLKANRRTVT